MTKINISALCTMLFLAAFLGCKEEEQAYDINWPVPEITALSPAQQMIEGNVTIEGNNFTRISRIRVGEVEVPEDNIVSMSETAIVVKIPRNATAGPVELQNIYDKGDVSENTFTPMYPATTITSFPSTIYRGQAFTISGENVDLITQVQVGGASIAVDGAGGSSTSISIPASDEVDLSGDMVTVTVTNAKGVLEGEVTANIPVATPGAFFEAVEPLVLFDFEDGANPYVDAGMGASAAINGGNVIKGRGQNYLHMEASNADASWFTYGTLTAAEVDPGAAGFHEPHISFLVNTNGGEGYFHMNVMQGGTTYEAHFNNAPDDYKFATEGWEWRSYTLDPNSEQAGEWKAQGFNPLQPFTMQLVLRTGNVGGGAFVVNLDQVMITDGPVQVVQTLFDFEDGANPYTGSANAGINASGVPVIRGNNYLTVTKPTVAKYEWTGEIVSSAVDLASLERPFINFWINTNGNNGNVQIETTQGDTKWGSDPFASQDYTIQTDGWELYSFDMTQLFVNNWNGGSAAAFDPKAIMDYVKIGFSAGNQETGVYEVNIDGVTISDGPIF